MRIAGVILAAGASRRMGRPKALLDWRGVTVIEHMVGLLGAVASPVIVVLGHHSEAIRERGIQATLVVNPNPERGMLSSLQCGLRAVPPEADAVLFTPADYPAVEAGTIRALAAGASSAPLTIPVFENRRGHPVLITRPLVAEILALPEQARPSDVIHRYLDRAMIIQVRDRGVVEDIDDPETYRRLRRECGE
ncbi:MAG: nucleotidyltransferase family protein [Bryobacterales bacterium]|nr:nucleotidyltransferase family protein [Bryobacterales bacterium]